MVEPVYVKLITSLVIAKGKVCLNTSEIFSLFTYLKDVSNCLFLKDFLKNSVTSTQTTTSSALVSSGIFKTKFPPSVLKYS
jgi:hypothetical protein